MTPWQSTLIRQASMYVILRIAKYLELCTRMYNLPRHLGQHSGGMVICAGMLNRIVPIERASMPGRTVVQWDKEDCADLGLDQSRFARPRHDGNAQRLARIDSDVTMAKRLTWRPCRKIHLFMKHSARPIRLECFRLRAARRWLPFLIMRRDVSTMSWCRLPLFVPVPIVGKMMHPYMRRRQGQEEVSYPHPLLEPVLKRTLGVPLFQEQLLRMAMVVASFTGSEAEELRRAVGMRRSMQRMRDLEGRLRAGMTSNGIGHKSRTTSCRESRRLPCMAFRNPMLPVSRLLHMPQPI